MAFHFFQTRKPFWRTDWFVGLLIAAGVLGLHLATDLVSGLERRFYDLALTSASRQPSDRIAIIAIDDRSIANIGRWPWHRDVHAQLIDRLVQGQARTIVHTTFFFEPQADRGLEYIQRIKGLLADPAEAATALGTALHGVVEEAELALDTDARLAQSLKRAGNVFVPSLYTLEEPQGRPDQPLPDFAERVALDDNSGFSLPASRGQQPLALFGEAAAGVGHLNQVQDVDGAVRQEPLLVNYYGQSVPSLALLAAAHSLNLQARDIRLLPGEGVQLGRLKIRTDAQALMLPQFYRMRDGRMPWAVESFHDVLSGKVPASRFAGKVVLIGATAAGVGVQFPVPGYPGLSPVETLAHIVSSVLSEHVIVQPHWSGWVALALFGVVLAYLCLLLPRLSAAAAALSTALVLLALLGTEFGLLARAAVWQPLVLSAVLLVLGHLGLTTKRFLMTEAGKLRSDAESAETNRMMGLALQGQGQLDAAFDRFKRVPATGAVIDNLSQLALDFERKRQFNKAQAVYDHILVLAPGQAGMEQRRTRARRLAETVMLSGTGAHPGGVLLLDDGQVEKPMLGRYQVEKELGKGAMGVVYQGRDPKIGRVVAIKTMALGQEFEGDELQEARQRFFREAETAGRLQHQHIVTIFDAGEEHDLAYIAMEFLQGRDLSGHCRPDGLLPVLTVLSIVRRVAEALDYAHRHQVVHRDIKPANIMYEPGADAVKVTDFGIARVTDSSRTKTGMVLGTPSFMSPEQLAGRRIDGRSDLYSLGVMLHQLLTGALPLRGESLSELMFKIANETPPDVRTLRPELSEGLARLVTRLLSKKPEDRFQNGAALAQALRQEESSTQEEAVGARVGGGLVYDGAEPPPGTERTQVLARPPAGEAPDGRTATGPDLTI